MKPDCVLLPRIDKDVLTFLASDITLVFVCFQPFQGSTR